MTTAQIIIYTSFTTLLILTSGVLLVKNIVLNKVINNISSRLNDSDENARNCYLLLRRAISDPSASDQVRSIIEDAITVLSSGILNSVFNTNRDE